MVAMSNSGVVPLEVGVIASSFQQSSNATSDTALPVMTNFLTPEARATSSIARSPNNGRLEKAFDQPVGRR